MSYYSRQVPPEKRSFFGLFVTVGTIAVIVAIVWFVVGVFYDSTAMAMRALFSFWNSALLPNGWNIFLATPFFWTLVAIVGLIAVWVWASANEESNRRYAVAMVLSITLIVGMVGYDIYKTVVYNLTGAGHNLSTTSFVVKDEADLPSMLTKQSNNGNLTVEVVQGDLPTSWASRVASATGALRVMELTSEAVNNTELMSHTMTYLYGEGSNGSWTAIRDGNNQQSIYGVSSWNGTGDAVETCRFEGDYQLDKAFGGLWGKNLGNAIAGAYPTFFYNDNDMWGYCDGDEPVIVIPGANLTGTDVRTADQSAGVVTVKGSKGGQPVISLLKDVKAGQFPGPVYAQRLVDQQRESLDFSAGYWASVNEHFGFEVTSVESQSGNNSNYLMKNEEDGRLYWVTPLKPQEAKSQTLIAYSVTPADEVSAPALNPQAVYVLNEDDERVVNLDDMLARVTDTVRDQYPGFFTGKNPGTIAEFLPVSDTQWQVFAEVSGRVKFRIDVDVDARITPKVVNVETGETVEPVNPDQVVSCDEPSSLSDTQLAACLVQLTGELQERNKGE